MHVSGLWLRDFRSYHELALTFQPGINVLLGRNGFGKTNLVEAIRFTSTLNSHRVAADAPLVRNGASRAVVRTNVQRNDQQLRLEVAINLTGANQLQISGAPVRPKELVGQLRSVLFAPEDLRIVRGDPSDRRQFIDELLMQRAPRYLGVKADYDKVLRQRTSLLKSIGFAKSPASRESAMSTLGVWDEQLADHGASLTFGRIRALSELKAPAVHAYADIATGSTIDLRYAAKTLVDTAEIESCSLEDIQDRLMSAIKSQREAEVQRGICLVGPHRDDLELFINGMPAKTHSSHGEGWSLALALRLGAFDMLRNIADGAGDPVLLLDDVFAELDVMRREALARVARDAEQVFITAAVAADVPHFESLQTFDVADGQAVAR